MTDEQILDLWGQASKNVGLKNPRHFDELREFAQLISDKIKEQTTNSMNRQWTLMCNKMIAVEIEKCAKMVEPLDESLADEIRARSQA